jgi:hypothetical protein
LPSAFSAAVARKTFEWREADWEVNDDYRRPKLHRPDAAAGHEHSKMRSVLNLAEINSGPVARTTHMS